MLITDNHKSNIIYLTDIDEQDFDCICKALIFLSECTNPITKVEDIVPELKELPNYKYLLPERNVKVKHKLIPNMENKFLSDALNWEEM